MRLTMMMREKMRKRGRGERRIVVMVWRGRCEEGEQGVWETLLEIGGRKRKGEKGRMGMGIRMRTKMRVRLGMEDGGEECGDENEKIRDEDETAQPSPAPPENREGRRLRWMGRGRDIGDVVVGIILFTGLDGHELHRKKTQKAKKTKRISLRRYV